MPNQQKSVFPPQHQDRQPGIESEMDPHPVFDNPNYQGRNKLQGKVALITGGDSGIGRAVAVAFAKEGADVAIVYLDEHGDAKQTCHHIEQLGRKCITLTGDVGDDRFCRQVIDETVQQLGGLDILVNNAAEQTVQTSLEDISNEQLERTFRTNIFSYFYITRSALPHLKQGSVIINTTSVTAYKGNEQLIDYASTKGAIVAFTRSLSLSLVKKGIRVNGVAPGPIWTPLIPSSFSADQVVSFGSNSKMGRAGQPVEIAPSYVFLASEDASYMTGQILHPNGGEIVNG